MYIHVCNQEEENCELFLTLPPTPCQSLIFLFLSKSSQERVSCRLLARYLEPVSEFGVWLGKQAKYLPR